MWEKVRKPLAAAVGVTIGGVCAILASQEGLVTIDPSSIVFVTVLLVDMSSAEAFYITATFRILGTLAGLLVGAGVSFITNAIVETGESGWGLNAFRLASMATFVFAAFYVEVNYPKYAYVSIIFVYTSAALVYSGTSNAVTVATIAAVIGGCMIASCVMWTFNYTSAEELLLESHQKLVTQVLEMIKWSVRANPRYKDDYFKFLDETKTAFDTNADCIANYLRWMKWTRRKPEFDFIALTTALRPLYNQTAAFFWALCRSRIVASSAEGYLDARYLYCITTEHYFEYFHSFVTEMVEAVESIQGKLTKIYKQKPGKLLGKFKRLKDRVLHENSKDLANLEAAELLQSILKDDLIVILRSIIRMRHRYGTHKLFVHPKFPQQWLFSDYIYQITLIVVDLLEYLRTTIETIISNPTPQRRLLRKLRVFAIRIEVIGNGGFLQATSFDEATGNLDEYSLRLISQSTEDDVDSELSSGSDADRKT